jgi:dihydrodipicolinate synthase/N-acetylneuraminate lyase
MDERRPLWSSCDLLTSSQGVEGVKSTTRLFTVSTVAKLHAEHMLIAFKDVWNDMPEVQAIRNVEERKRLLDHLVKLCIDAYYRR